MSVLTGALLGDEDGATGIDRRAPCKANLRVAGRFLGLFASNRLHFYFPGQLDTRTSNMIRGAARQVLETILPDRN
jgi:hypothetical protein